MIEIIHADRCTACNICVAACPTNVFDAVPGQAPRIARQADCQTCFMCELYCPEDALFVAPGAAPAAPPPDVASSQVAPLMGSYRKAVGWGKGMQPGARADHTFELLKRAH